MRYLICVFLVITYSFGVTQTPQWKWIERGGGIGTWSPSVPKADDDITAMEVDDEGNVYVSANIVASSNATIGSTKLKGFRGYFDGVVAKFDCDGNLLWHLIAGGRSTDGIEDIAVDSEGNVYITGDIFAGYSATDSAYIGDSAYHFWNQRAFVAKLDSNGKLLWKHIAYRNGPTGQQGSSGKSLGLDEFNNLYVYGFTFVDSGYYAPGHLIKWGDYIAKYSTDGHLFWIKQIKEYPSPLRVQEMEVDINGTCYFTGSIIDTIEFGGKQFNMSNPNAEAIVMEYDSSGKFQWAHVSESPFLAGAAKITIDKSDKNSNSFYIVGNTGRTVKFGNLTITAPYLTGLGFLVKYQNRIPVWIRYSIANAATGLYDVNTDPHGNVYVATQMPSGSTKMEIGGMKVKTNRRSPIFASFTSSGDTVFLESISTNSQYGFINAIRASYNGNVYLGGSFSHGLNIGTDSVYCVGGYSDIYLAKYGIDECEDTTTVDTTNTGIDLQSLNEKILVYPNPSSGEVEVTFEMNQSTFYLELIEIQGAVLKTWTFSNTNRATLDISNYSEGIYLLRVSTGSKTETVRVVKGR